MEVVVVETSEEIGRLAADAVAGLLRTRPNAVLGLATGSSPVPLYTELGRRVDAGELSLSQCTAFLLDEYVGIPADHPERYRNVIERDIVSLTDLPTQRVHAPDGLAEDIPGACAAYERAIASAGGVDLQVLGIGSNGHIAFNEPGSSLASRTRVKVLTAQTREDNARFFDDDVDKVPRYCLTQGIGTIMEARHLVLIATGRGKAEAVFQLVEGPVSALWPATVLQMHPHVTVFLDLAAASRLTLEGYYAQMWADKPSWQGF